MNNFWAFLNTNFFSSLATFLTVAGAVAVYLFQKWENKQQIARLLVNEIRNAEEALRLLKTRPEAIDLPEIVILPQNNWSKYSYLFTKDFDEDEIRSINRFYSDCERAHYVISQGNSMELFLLQVKQRSDAIHHKLVEMINDDDANESKGFIKEFKKKLDSAIGLYHYSPKGFADRLDKYLQNINTILDTSAGSKLKQLAGVD